MRRLGLLTICCAVIAAVVLVIGTVAQGSSSYTFHALFYDAYGLIPGQTVKIAGAKVASISNVTVTTGNRAEVTATIPGTFRFHSNASCIIRPDGLIAENYIDCDPGTASGPLLANATVPVSQTQEPVSLLDLFNTFNLPTRERFQVLIDELGISTAGQGTNINAILQRANPTLGLARRVIGILDAQNRQIATAIDATNTIAADGAAHTVAVRSFIQRASALTQLTSNHASPLSAAIANLPGLLRQAQPALAQLDTVARDGTPLLSDINTAIPYLKRVDTDIRPFARLARPALRDLSGTIRKAIPTVRNITPLLKTIKNYLFASAPTTKTFSTLIVNLIQHGFAENFQSVVYYVANALAHKDGVGHQLATLLTFPQNGACGTYATKPVAGCQSHYGSQPAFTPSSRHHTAHRVGARRRSATTTVGAAPAAATPSAGGASNLPSQLAGPIGEVISRVAGGAGAAVGAVGQGVGQAAGGVLGAGGTTTSSQGGSRSPSGLRNLMNFLFK